MGRILDTKSEIRTLSWNIRGMKLCDLDLFLTDLSNNIPWDIIAVQEFGPWGVDGGREIDGHLILSSRKCVGSRPTGIIVHRDFRGCFVEGSFVCEGRASAADFVQSNRKFRFVCSHLAPGGGLPSMRTRLAMCKNCLTVALKAIR